MTKGAMGERLTVMIAGEEVPVMVRRNAQARRLILRIDSHSAEIKLTLPKYASQRAAKAFLDKQHDWILAERAAIDSGIKIRSGETLAYLGVAHRIEFTGQAPRKVIRENGVIAVGGPSDMAVKRLEAWLRKEATLLLSERAHVHAAALGFSFNKVSIGDMKSRWGSCSSSGTLRFSWRLLMAPFEVLDYVAAHEVAHLGEMNHSDRFWALVAKCVPEHKERRAWLKNQGNALFKVRFEG